MAPQPIPYLIYKIAARALYDRAVTARTFIGAPIDLNDGFIHLSTAAQLAETLRLHFAGRSGLVVFAVRTADLGNALRWEPSRGGALFPHLYGPLPMSSVTDHADVDVAADGSVALPAFVR